MTVRVSVVVPTYRRDELLARCLRALCAQKLDPAAYEVIVVDDACCDGTRRLVETWAEAHAGEGPAPPLRYLAATGNRGPAAARNVGWRTARGPIVAFTDDDCIPDPTWLSAGLAGLADDIDAAWGSVIVPLPASPTDYQLNATGIGDGAFITANCFCRPEILATTGGFDERFTAAWREDSDLYFTLLKRGCRVVRIPDAVVVHPVRPERWGVSLRQQRKSVFNALLYKKHPTFYRQIVQAAPPWRYYRIVAFAITTVAGALRGSPLLALAGFTGWIYLTARFCAERLRDTSRSPKHVAEMIVTSALIPPLAIFWRLVGAVKFRVVFL